MSSSASTYDERQALRKAHLESNDAFVTCIPKVELHVHIEGTLTPSLRWKLSQRNNVPLTAGSDKVPLKVRPLSLGSIHSISFLVYDL